MGLVQLLLKDEEFIRLYNCNFYSVDIIPLEERQDKVFAVFVVFFKDTVFMNGIKLYFHANLLSLIVLNILS
jgi:hypothetical protein